MKWGCESEGSERKKEVGVLAMTRQGCSPRFHRKAPTCKSSLPFSLSFQLSRVDV